MKKIITIVILFLTIHQTYAVDNGNYFGSVKDTKLFYKIGGDNVISKPIYRPSTNIKLGANARANIGYSCGEFDTSTSYTNLMDNVKDGLGDTVDAVQQTANAAIAALPSLILQRLQPGLYNMLQEYRVAAETDIDIATQSCEDMEAEIARGGNPHARFLQQAKALVWEEEVVSGDIVRAKKKAEDSPEDSGVISYGGEKVGGQGQPALKVVAGAVKAGYNFILNQDNATANSQAPINSRLSEQFSNANEAADWTTDVIGEYEINNTKETPKIGTGLLPKVDKEKAELVTAVNHGEYNKIGVNNVVIAKLKTMNTNQQQILLSNIITNKSIEKTIERALTARRLLLAGSQDADDTNSNEERGKRITQLEEEIRIIMFEHDIRQKLGNQTILNILNNPNITSSQLSPDPAEEPIQLQ